MLKHRNNIIKSAETTHSLNHWHLMIPRKVQIQRAKNSRAKSFFLRSLFNLSKKKKKKNCKFEWMRNSPFTQSPTHTHTQLNSFIHSFNKKNALPSSCLKSHLSPLSRAEQTNSFLLGSCFSSSSLWLKIHGISFSSEFINSKLLDTFFLRI